MKKKCLKFLVIIGLLTILLTTISTTQVQAVLQSNGGTSTTNNMDGWIVNIRRMEATGGTLGLNETINTTGLLATTESNGLDCHMEKNTEYGAMVLLSASSYGNPSKIESGETTTGNSTGVVMNINREWVAAGNGLVSSKYCRNANSRYIHNDYEDREGKRYRIGDAMEQGRWHGSGSYDFNISNTSGLIRSHSGSIFSYYASGSNSNLAAFYEYKYASRAVIVIGEGL